MTMFTRTSCWKFAYSSIFAFRPPAKISFANWLPKKKLLLLNSVYGRLPLNRQASILPLSLSCRECCCQRNGRSVFGFMTQCLTGVVSTCPGGATRKVILQQWLFLRHPPMVVATFHILQEDRRGLVLAGSILWENFHIRGKPDCASFGKATM